ncbi:MAG TPA: peptidoglycan DD-metalloendopeptidase family protein [Bacteroidales bacterium]|nr:peptidoglycan DD-metalloendopeptidase family protein [Bacteroidales bacterium]
MAIKGNKIKIPLLLFCFFIAMTVVWFYPFAQNQQTKDKLIDKKKKIEEEISYYKKLLGETQKNKELSLNQLVILKKQISKREELIGGINDEISGIDQKISENNQNIQRSNEQLTSMKTEYATLIYNAYKNRSSYDRIMLIFAADDFNQAFQRIKYFQQYNEYLRRQVALIQQTKDFIAKKNEELAQQKVSKENLLQSSEAEKQKLSEEKAKKDTDLKKLKQKESELRKKLKKKEEEARTLKKKIEAAINAEIKKSAVKSNKTVTSTTTVKNVMTPEEKLVSDNFMNNKGKLPWPVERGTITGYFGEHPHPVLDGIKIKNNGIDISTTQGSAARAVLSGTVSSVMTITNNNVAVIIRHGEFFTVYSNLGSVNVNKNQSVSTKQNIGTVYTNSDEGKTELHFEVWQGKVICNPAEWLAKR